jgi:hypothetical protein
VAELNGSNQVVSRFVYASKANVPDYMISGGVTYRLISDHLGSVRLVANASTGAVAQRGFSKVCRSGCECDGHRREDHDLFDNLWGRVGRVAELPCGTRDGHLPGRRRFDPRGAHLARRRFGLLFEIVPPGAQFVAVDGGS